MPVTELQNKISFRTLIYLVKITISNSSIVKADPPLNIPLSVQIILAIEESLAEGKLRSLKPVVHEVKCMGF
jgi:hypothetical protein